TPTETATWTFSGLAPGQYGVAATWVGYKASAATNAPFAVADGTTLLTPSPVRVDQTVDAAGFGDGASAWQSLGTFTVTGSTLVVQLTNDANGYVSADAVRVQRAGYAGQVVDNSGPGFAAQGQWVTNYTEPGAHSFQGTSA